MKTILLEEDKIAATIGQIPPRPFTVLDFSEVFKTLYPADWRLLVARFGQLGEKRRTSMEEQQRFGSPWIAVFKKKG